MDRKLYLKKYSKLFSKKNSEKFPILKIVKEKKEFNNNFKDLSRIKIIGKSDSELIQLGSKISDLVKLLNLKNVFVNNNLSDKEITQVAKGFLLKNWTFNNYKENKITLEKIIFKSKNPDNSEKFLKILHPLIESILWGRELVNRSSNDLTPEVFMKSIKKEIKDINIRVISGKDIVKEGFNLVDAVAKGSVNEGQIVIIEYRGEDKKKIPDIALIGKGVCFDAGGISIKPSRNMHDMIFDMTGAAAVVTATKALIENKCKQGFYAIVGLVENMPSGSATKPGDIFECTFSKKNCEILNTDAEGRMVLADLAAFSTYNLGCKKLISIATLTGAAEVAIGFEYAPLCSNSYNLSSSIIKASKNIHEKVFPMPFGEEYNSYIEGTTGHLRNISKRGAGVIAGGKFIQLNSKDGTEFAHLDIANSVETNSIKNSLCSAPYECFGTSLLYETMNNIKKDENNHKNKKIKLCAELLFPKEKK